jgi:uridine kinase
MSFTKVAIAGVSSEAGKTTLLCELLREFPGWEAIKMTRGSDFQDGPSATVDGSDRSIARKL